MVFVDQVFYSLVYFLSLQLYNLGEVASRAGYTSDTLIIGAGAASSRVVGVNAEVGVVFRGVACVQHTDKQLEFQF